MTLHSVLRPYARRSTFSVVLLFLLQPFLIHADAPKAPQPTSYVTQVGNEFIRSYNIMEEEQKAETPAQEAPKSKKEKPKNLGPNLAIKQMPEHEKVAICFEIFAHGDATPQSSIIDATVPVSLELLCGPATHPGISLHSKMFRHITSMGRADGALKLLSPITDISTLEARQNVIRELVNNPTLFGQLEALLKEIAETEDALLGLWRELDKPTQAAYNSLYFGRWFNKLNESSTLLNACHHTTPVGPFVAATWPAAIPLAAAGVLYKSTNEILNGELFGTMRQLTPYIEDSLDKNKRSIAQAHGHDFDVLEQDILKERNWKREQSLKKIARKIVNRAQKATQLQHQGEETPQAIAQELIDNLKEFINPSEATQNQMAQMGRHSSGMQGAMNSLIGNASAFVRGGLAPDWQPTSYPQTSIEWKPLRFTDAAQIVGHGIRHNMHWRDNIRKLCSDIADDLREPITRNLGLTKLAAATGVVAGPVLLYLGGLLGSKNAFVQRRDAVNSIQNRLIHISSCLRALDEICTTCTFNETLRTNFASLRQLGHLLAERQAASAELKQLLEDLHTNTFTGTPSFFSHAGRVLTTWKRLNALKQELAPLIKLIGELDTYLAVARLIKEHEGTNTQYCFVEFVDQDQPLFELEGFWNPFLNPATAVLNDFCLGTACAHGARAAIITGPNAGGKSTSMKAAFINALLSQTFGVGAARRVRITPFNKLHAYLNITDDTTMGESLFKAEVKRCQQLVADISSLYGTKKAFAIIDELFCGTAPDAGAAASFGVTKKLSEFRTTLFMLATHFIDTMPRLERETAGVCKNFKVTVSFDPAGKPIYPFNLVRGIADQSTALAILAESGISSDILQTAREQLAHAAAAA